MLINGVDLSSLGVQLYDRILTSNEVETTQDWLEGDIQPTFIRQQDKFKNMRLKFLVTETNEENAFMVMSKLAMMLKKATIVFDDINLLFDVVMDGQTSQERLKNGNFILTVDLLSNYAKGQIEVYTTDARATDYFYLNVVYYTKGNILVGTKKVLIKASQFNGITDTFESLGINLNEFRPDYYNDGAVTNFTGKELNYDNLYNLQTLIINYSPVIYSKEVEYFLADENNTSYSPITTITTTFTKEQVDNALSIGQIINLTTNKPNGYRARVNFNLDLTFENLMSFSPLQVYYDKIVNEQTKEITINYFLEVDNSTILAESQIVLVKEGDLVDGTQLKDLFNVNAYKPEKYYNDGICQDYDLNALVDFDSLQASYDIYYNLSENIVLVEYYLGNYPNWSRITTNTYKVKYHTSFDTTEDIIDAVGIDLNKYNTDTYEYGAIHNGETIENFDSLLTLGVLQVYYTPKDYTLRVSYSKDELAIGYQNFTINDYMFISNPVLSEIIDINAMKPEGYIYSPELSYDGEVSLSALLAAAPISIVYVPVEEIRTKSILVKYKQELASAYSTINTSVITIEESSVGGGIKLSDLIDLNAYKPEYYDNGIIDGASSSSVVLFDEIQGTYDVLYMATSYNTQVRYYTDTVENTNWIGSASLHYRIIDFTTTTTLIDLGLNVNAFKPSYCGDGIVQYTGPVTFQALINLDAINIVYEAETEPEDPDGIDYPHRILWLQHNDMGNYEHLFPNWTLNHAYINTGVTVPDMSKLTVLCDTFRVFETEPLHNVNVDDSYLFGSITPQGSYYIKYVNNTSYKQESLLTGINTFNAAAGYGTPELVLEESASEGFSANTGITASSRDGYSYATLTYTHLVQSNSAPMNVPLYLFACNQNGYYRGGIAGVGIKSCKIYYEDVLIRDYVPVAFYDKIGDKVAPSNCLYDKVTQTFFEDARGLNSFNIMDDPDYVDTNPEHMIGCCYVNYYKDETLFNTATVWFRGSDFVDKEFNPYEKFFVDYYQPQYYGSGEIVDLAQVGDITFNNMQNKIFNVVYKSTGYNVVVNYWRDNKENQANLLGTEVVTLTEKDFYQVPTFGDLIPIQKYKPEGYVANYSYPESKVTLNRVMQHSPYDIIYTEVENPQVYETKITYLRKRFGIDILNPEQTYENLGSITLQLDETQFAEGVYIEEFIDMNAMYPVSPIEGKPFYDAGVPFEWYLDDEMLATPEDLKSEYKISYEPVIQYIDVNYYTDVVEEENLIASTTWGIKINDWPDNGQFCIVDELPNIYIDKYKPVICGGGRVNEPEKVWTFETLVAAGEISIIYDTLDEPHDPESSMFPSKVIYFNRFSKELGTTGENWTDTAPNIDRKYYTPEVGSENIYTPYLDLGYKPKEIGRLRMETKAYSLSNGNSVGQNAHSYGYAGDSYEYILGYYGALDAKKVTEMLGTPNAENNVIMTGLGKDEESLSASEWSPNSSGWMAIKGHGVKVAGFVYTHPMPQYFDGWPTFNLNTNMMNDGYNTESVRALYGGWRKGFYSTGGNNWEDINTYKDYIVYKDEGYKANASGLSYNWYGIDGDKTYPTKDQRISGVWEGELTDFEAVVFNPWTITIDAYHNFVEMYDYTNSTNPEYNNVKDEDQDIFTRRCVPKGTISLFITTNPDTGEVNWLPNTVSTYLIMGTPLHGLGQAVVGMNPWSDTFNPTITYETQVITGTMEDGTPIYETVKKTININHASYQGGVFNSPMRCMVWYVKIWDRDKLVRNLIPVAAGDQIYDYIMPSNGMFDLVTETFFGNQNKGGTYTTISGHSGNLSYNTITVTPDEIFPLEVIPDPTVWGNIVVNYYDDDNNFLGNQYVEIPVHYKEANTTIEEICHHNDFKPNEFYHDGMIDIDLDLTKPTDKTLQQIYEAGSINIYYKLITFTKTVVYYQGNSRVGSKDLFYSIDDIDKAETLTDLGIDVDLYASDDFAPGRIVFNEQVIADDDIKTFIDASSPIVVYDKLSKEENPNLLYLEYYRGGAYDDNLITLDEEDPNYLNCDLDAVALNPNGVIKYIDHYHSALYEDEEQDYFIAYQVDVNANYVPVHKGPARRYPTLAIIVDKGRYTVLEEKEGWGRLKEYPTGWIMLSYTESVTGPGQNPDYDESNEATVTIPFGTRFTINKMTVDRLWCYSPEYASWVKAEEISFDQSGKLYNALAMKVIHLDEVDWDNVTNITDIGIYSEAYKLKYHDNSNYTYEGELTQAAFSELHNIEFVYPETVYAYNCLFYKDTILDTNEIGRESFSCSMSDWNPDWDTFIATSWQVDENGFAINPTLYRDTELTLTWDYFGIDRNAYKPALGNYDDGIFLWNPRTYENHDVYFTFEELVTTGVQTILYVHTLQNYKLVTESGSAPAIPVSINFTPIPSTCETAAGIWDIEWKKGSALRDAVSKTPYTHMDSDGIGMLVGGGIQAAAYYEQIYISGSRVNNYYTYEQGTPKNLPALSANRKYVITNISNKRNATSIYSYGNDTTGFQSPYYVVRRSGGKGISAEIKENDVEIIKSLDLRNEEFDQLRRMKYTAEISKEYHEWINSIDWSTIEDEMNYIWTTWDGETEYSNPDHSYTWGNTRYLVPAKHNLYSPEKMAASILDEIYASGTTSSPFYYLKIWKNYYLEHYYVPVARGTWLEDGRQVPYNTVYDIITNTICECEDIEAAAYNQVFEVGEEVTEENLFSPFDSWNFDYTDCNYNIQTTATVKAYKYPDVLAVELTEYPTGSVIPVRRYTADAANKVIGEWYYNGYAWFQTTDTTILPTDTYVVEDATPVKMLALKGTTADTAKSYKAFLEPAEGTTTDAKTYTSESVVGMRYKSGDFYWNEISGWIPVQATEENTEDIDINYVVSIASLNVFSHPINNLTYRINVLLSGDRIKATKKLVRDEKWQYIPNIGWIEATDATVSELV